MAEKMNRERQIKILKKLHRLQIKHIGVKTMWVETDRDDLSVELIIIEEDEKKTARYYFYEFYGDERIEEEFAKLDKYLKGH
ncbi:MAG: hypothetical protein KBS70_06970 [Bacteroidales bacterium]|nr:hypothetical protein [Candidatus Colicola equi]